MRANPASRCALIRPPRGRRSAGSFPVRASESPRELVVRRSWCAANCRNGMRARCRKSPGTRYAVISGCPLDFRRVFKTTTCCLMYATSYRCQCHKYSRSLSRRRCYLVWTNTVPTYGAAIFASQSSIHRFVLNFRRNAGAKQDRTNYNRDCSCLCLQCKIRMPRSRSVPVPALPLLHTGSSVILLALFLNGNRGLLILLLTV